MGDKDRVIIDPDAVEITGPALCWCGRMADYLVKYSMPDDAVAKGSISIETPVCDGHKMETFNAIKWKLVFDGTWYPECMTLEPIDFTGVKEKKQ